MTNAFILCDLVWKVQESHAANREGRFKHHWHKWYFIFTLYQQPLVYPLQEIAAQLQQATLNTDVNEDWLLLTVSC